MVLFTGIGAVIGAISATFYTVSGLFVKKMTGNVSAITICFSRMLTIAVISLIIVLTKRIQFWQHNLSDYVYMHMISLAVTVQIILLYYSFQVLPLADVITIESSSPLFIAIARFVFYKRIPTILEGTMMILTVAGVILCIQPSFIFAHLQQQHGEATRSSINYSLPILSVLGFSTSYLCFEKISKEVDVTTTMLIYSLVSAVISYAYLLVIEGLKFPFDIQNVSYLGVACITSYFASQTSFLAVKVENSLMASVGRATDILISYVIDVYVFNLVPTFVTLIGAAMILFTLLLPALVYVIKQQCIVRSASEIT
ncbi:Uncharacterised protein r2_g3892 [Pycnogonum litorale]